MINLTVMYPYGTDKKFDKEYFVSKHIPLVASIGGTLIKGVHRELGLCGATPDSPPAFFSIAHLSFNSIEDINTFIGNAGPIFADITNYTDVTPIIQMSEVKSS